MRVSLHRVSLRNYPPVNKVSVPQAGRATVRNQILI